MDEVWLPDSFLWTGSFSLFRLLYGQSWAFCDTVKRPQLALNQQCWHFTPNIIIPSVGLRHLAVCWFVFPRILYSYTGQIDAKNWGAVTSCPHSHPIIPQSCFLSDNCWAVNHNKIVLYQIWTKILKISLNMNRYTSVTSNASFLFQLDSYFFFFTRNSVNYWN